MCHILFWLSTVFVQWPLKGALSGGSQALAAAHRGHLLLVYVTGSPAAFILVAKWFAKKQ